MRSNRTKQFWLATAAVGAIALVGVGVAQLGQPTTDPEILSLPSPISSSDAEVVEPSTEPDESLQAERLLWPEGPSQSPADAAAQGVPGEVAALALADRMSVLGGTTTPEGVYVSSRPPWDSQDQPGDADGRLSDGSYVYEYEELLLLDPETLSILHAWPTAGLSLVDAPLVLDSLNIVAAYRAGDGAEPWSSLILIDRATRERTGFVGTTPSDVDQEDATWTTASWLTRDVELMPHSLLGELDGRLTGMYDGEIVAYDHTTLAGTRRPDPVTARSLSPTGGGTFVERGVNPSRFMVASEAGIVSASLPPLPGFAMAAATTNHPPVAVVHDATKQDRRVLYVLEDNTWEAVARTAEYPRYM